MKTAKFVAVAIVFAALLIVVGSQAYAQGTGPFGPWRYNAAYHLPAMGSCMGPFLLKPSDYAPKYEYPLPPAPGPKRPCPPPRTPRKVKAPPGQSFGAQMYGPPMPAGLLPPAPMQSMPMPIAPCPGGVCPVS